MSGRPVFTTAAALLSACTLLAEPHLGVGSSLRMARCGRDELLVGPGAPHSFVKPSPQRRSAASLQVAGADLSVGVSYTGFTPQAQAAFQYAVDLWRAELASPVPVIINASFEPLGTGVLGSAGAGGIISDFPGAPVAGTWYPIALANQLAGVDLDPSGPDINARFGSTFNWYFGTDGAAPTGTFDFVTVVMHELGHGLGLLGSGNVSAAGEG